jgi:hypothetical protein
MEGGSGRGGKEARADRLVDKLWVFAGRNEVAGSLVAGGDME